MTRTIGDRLPAVVVDAFDGRDLERKIGPAYLLISLDADSTARPCMLSAGEILAMDDRRLRVALWPGTGTSGNLARGGPVLLCFVAPEVVLYVRGRPRALGAALETRLEGFEIEVDTVESDAHAGMPVRQAITFSIGSTDPATVVRTWTRQLEGLRLA